MPGAFADLDTLINLRLKAQQPLVGNLLSASQLGAGNRRSPRRGQGLEFDRLRPYQAGDDLRSIDWRITARTQKPFTRLYQGEHERPLLLWIDQRPSLHFGSRHAFKAVQALEAAALLAWSALVQGDRIGALLGNGSERLWLPPKRGQRPLLQLLNQCVAFNRQAQPTEPDPLAEDLAELHQRAAPGSTLVLISDFLARDRAADNLLTELGRKHALIGLIPFDPLEFSPPPAGAYRIAQNGQSAVLACRRGKERHAYRSEGQARRAELESLLSRCRASVHWLSTAKPVSEQLKPSGRGGL